MQTHQAVVSVHMNERDRKATHAMITVRARKAVYTHTRKETREFRSNLGDILHALASDCLRMGGSVIPLAAALCDTAGMLYLREEPKSWLNSPER
jgi:hypothetical protein